MKIKKSFTDFSLEPFSVNFHERSWYFRYGAGIFVQLRTRWVGPSHQTTVITDYDPRISRLGRLFLNTKLDELPQLVHVLFGQMSFVGPRPDVPKARGLESGVRNQMEKRIGFGGRCSVRERGWNGCEIGKGFEGLSESLCALYGNIPAKQRMACGGEIFVD